MKSGSCHSVSVDAHASTVPEPSGQKSLEQLKGAVTWRTLQQRNLMGELGAAPAHRMVNNVCGRRKVEGLLNLVGRGWS